MDMEEAAVLGARSIDCVRWWRRSLMARFASFLFLWCSGALTPGVRHLKSSYAWNTWEKEWLKSIIDCPSLTVVATLRQIIASEKAEVDVWPSASAWEDE